MGNTSMIKAPLYLVSLIPVVYSWKCTGFSNSFLFTIILFFAIASQLFMNIEMDSEDQERGLKCFESEPLLNVGPCHMMLFKRNQIKLIRASSLALMLIIAVLVLLITRMLILIIYGLAGIALMYAYLKKPLELYKRGIGEISTFFDFGPVLVLGSYTALGGRYPLSLTPLSVGFGLIASSIRYSHHLVEEKEGSRRKRFYPYVHFALLFSSSLTALNLFKVLLLMPVAILVSVYAARYRYKTWADLIYLLYFFSVVSFL
ncbi:MAG: prenyltransferase [Nitrososphaeria archaeon]